tara:strand:- start:1990 stop:2769 length:780 start_codon:yes stop_codon:yes gene_type:complete
MKKILFLGYSKKETSLIEFLQKNYFVKSLNKKISNKDIKGFDIIICYGYRLIVDKKILNAARIPIINLHIGFLPFNRGSHPNFWAFVENTISGVTIHEVSETIDTGKIIYQKLIDFKILENKKKLTFADTYNILIKEVEKLFIIHHKKIIEGRFVTYKQIGKGTFHKSSELPSLLKSWDQNIYKTILKFDSQKNNLLKKHLEILDKIENTRMNNNVNWMNILRTSIKASSSDTLKILMKINSDDNKISKLFNEFQNEKK